MCQLAWETLQGFIVRVVVAVVSKYLIFLHIMQFIFAYIRKKHKYET